MPGRAGEQPKVEDSELVFVGYGVVAPEYGWDDFKGTDVRGKTLIMLVGDPPVPDPKDPTKLDPALFKGRAMTYYGRWTYKYEIAAKLGAAAAILVHEDGPAGYPFSVVQGSWSRENFDIVPPAGAPADPAVKVKGWIDSPTAKELCHASGHEMTSLKAAALRRDFRPVALGASARIAIAATSRQVQSHNVIARLEGSDPALQDEYVVFTAHWDHLGKDPESQGRPDLQRRGRQRLGRGRRARDRPGVHAGSPGPETFAALPLRHRRGEGPAGLEVLRQRSALPARRKPWPTSTST